MSVKHIVEMPIDECEYRNLAGSVLDVNGVIQFPSDAIPYQTYCNKTQGKIFRYIEYFGLEYEPIVRLPSLGLSTFLDVFYSNDFYLLTTHNFSFEDRIAYTNDIERADAILMAVSLLP